MNFRKTTMTVRYINAVSKSNAPTVPDPTQPNPNLTLAYPNLQWWPSMHWICICRTCIDCRLRSPG